VSEAALAPKMGPVTEEELAALEKWRSTTPKDPSLETSLEMVRAWERAGAYTFIRALRAGVKLEDLL
jgi:hypothetical protein